jgi:hypothetical protein
MGATHFDEVTELTRTSGSDVGTRCNHGNDDSSDYYYGSRYSATPIWVSASQTVSQIFPLHFVIFFPIRRKAFHFSEELIVDTTFGAGYSQHATRLFSTRLSSGSVVLQISIA